MAPLEPAPNPAPLDPDEVAAVLEYGGPFAHYFAGYEHRPEQVEMLRAVTSALSDGHHLMVEAGTGTGKSFAYLVPAALWALQNKLRVVISTNTINLQDQLIKKDIPDLRKALNLRCARPCSRDAAITFARAAWKSCASAARKTRMRCACWPRCWSGCRARQRRPQ